MSAKGIGRLIQLAIAKEAVRGTAQSSPTFWVPFSDASPESKILNATDNMAYGLIEIGVSQTRVKNWMEGDLKAIVRDIHTGLIFKSIMGTETVTTHTGESTVYDHKFTVAESAQHQSLTLFKHDPLASQDYAYPLTVVHKLDLDYALSKFINYSASLKSQAGTQVSTLSPSTTAENYFVPQYLTFTVASNLSGIGSGTTIALKSAKLTIDDTVEDQDVLGSLSPADFLNKGFKVEGTLEAIWKGETDFFTNYIANTPQALQLSAVNTDVTIGTSSHPSLIIQLAKAYFTELTKPIKIDDLVYQTLKFTAVYSTGDAQMINIVLTNTQSTAY